MDGALGTRVNYARNAPLSLDWDSEAAKWKKLAGKYLICAKQFAHPFADATIQFQITATAISHSRGGGRGVSGLAHCRCGLQCFLRGSTS